MKSWGKPGPAEIEQLKRLIEIQTQIVELAKQNENAKKECEALREELSREMRRRARRASRRVVHVAVAAGEPSNPGSRFASVVGKLLRRMANLAAAGRTNLFPPRRDA